MCEPAGFVVYKNIPVPSVMNRTALHAVCICARGQVPYRLTCECVLDMHVWHVQIKLSKKLRVLEAACRLIQLQ